ncbi:hypothetical protein QYE76_056270 [Lolium multiflorum]|uniref:Reverse transcriptase zinc-binding domain-containing protein n=1 Tax=Lolium multiflorum TaxID=4521 RepID=A0AAD8WN18_LOLMU|nr:hypothetical protein QYE76_056270 [Lolium multiflorum]
MAEQQQRMTAGMQVAARVCEKGASGKAWDPTRDRSSGALPAGQRAPSIDVGVSDVGGLAERWPRAAVLRPGRERLLGQEEARPTAGLDQVQVERGSQAGGGLRPKKKETGEEKKKKELRRYYRAQYQSDPEREDSFMWRWSADRNFSVRSAYAAFFAGTTVVSVASEIWRSRAPYSCKFFPWLVSRKSCWTADRLQRHGLPPWRPGA